MPYMSHDQIVKFYFQSILSENLIDIRRKPLTQAPRKKTGNSL